MKVKMEGISSKEKTCLKLIFKNKRKQMKPVMREAREENKMKMKKLRK